MNAAPEHRLRCGTARLEEPRRPEPLVDSHVFHATLSVLEQLLVEKLDRMQQVNLERPIVVVNER